MTGRCSACGCNNNPQSGSFSSLCRRTEILCGQRQIVLQDQRTESGFTYSAAPSVWPVRCLVELHGTALPNRR